MHYGILGPAQAHRDDGTPVALGGARLRALFTALALRPGRTRTAEALIAEVWADDDPPADAAGALQALVGRLRRALGHAAVAGGDGGYRLCAGTDDVDLHRFDRLAAEGARALADGAPEKAAGLLDEALALWRGPALADLPDRAAPAARADSRRFAARRDRLAADLALGRAAQVLPALTELCDSHPLDEPLQALRLRALRDTGRPADALAAYETVRRELADRLGADPSPELRALHAELLRPEPLPDRPEGNLRERLNSFVGREDDLAALRDDLGAARLVTLVGTGGAGKTRLAEEAARTAEDLPDGVWMVELAAVEDPDAVPEAVLGALGGREVVMRGSSAEGLRAAPDPAVGEPLTRLAEHCAPRRMLLVLDNCEHVVAAAAGLAEHLLTRCPGVTVLATSREPLGVPGELVRPVGPLPLPVGLRLLADRGAAARPGFRIAEDRAAAEEICRRLDGLPLAIELAAARLRLLTPRQLADRLDDRFRLLTSGARTVLPRQQTLRAVVDWSWELLDAPERAVLRRLSVFAGGCDAEAAEAVCADDAAPVGTDDAAPDETGRAGPPPGLPGAGTPPPAGAADAAGRPGRQPCRVGPRDVLALLGALVDKSLVVADPDGDGGMRYRLLETVSEYAAERLAEAGERESTGRRHRVYFRELARTADPLLRGPEQGAWLRRLEREHDNLRAALRRAVAAGEEQDALCLTLSLTWYWQLHNHGSEARFWCGAVAALGPDPFAPPLAPAPPLTVRPIDTAPPMEPELLQEARRQIRLVSLANLEGDLATWEGDDAQRDLQSLVTVYTPTLPQICRVPGVAWFWAVLIIWDMERMRKAVDDAVAACRAFGHTWELGFLLHLRSRIAGHAHLAGPSRSSRDADESLEIFVSVGDAWGAAEALAARGEKREQSGEHALAADDYREAMRYAEQVGARAQVALLSARLAGALVEQGEVVQGERVLREVLAKGHRANTEARVLALLRLAQRCGHTGRTGEARGLLYEAMQVFADRRIEIFQSLVQGMVSWVDVLEGRPEEALAGLRPALVTAQDSLALMVAPHMAVSHLLTAARALSAIGGERHSADAARLLGAFDVLHRPLYRPESTERESRAVAERTARAALGDTAYEREYAEGGRLSVAEAAALV